MKITLTKVSLTHHQLLVERDDGSKEQATLETKSFIPHDFIHYAFEKRAELRDSFWGRIAKGGAIGAVEVPPNDEIMLTEMITGALTGFLKSDGDPGSFVDLVKNYLEGSGYEMPAYLTPQFLIDFREDLRRLMGQWNGLKKDQPMVLKWID